MAKVPTGLQFNKEDYAFDLAAEISEMIIEARIKKGMSQEKLAKSIGTKQSSIARLENGNSLPSLRFLEKIAKALDTKIVPPKFAFLEESQSENIVRKGNLAFLKPQINYTPLKISYSHTSKQELSSPAFQQ